MPIKVKIKRGTMAIIGSLLVIKEKKVGWSFFFIMILKGNETIGFFFVFFFPSSLLLFVFSFPLLSLLPLYSQVNHFFFASSITVATFMLYPGRFAWDTPDKPFKSMTATPHEVQPRSWFSTSATTLSVSLITFWLFQPSLCQIWKGCLSYLLHCW